MALSPTIPTSFVPKQPVPQAPRHVSSGNNIFLVVALILMVIAIALAAGTFFYAQYLTSVENAKAAELVAAQSKVSQSSVDDFVRLHNRFIAAAAILDQHVALSQFFTLLGSITVKNVTFTSLNIQVADDRSATITMMGDAADFNSLAAESTIFAQQPDITSAIFSGISVNKDGTVAFSLSANLKPALVIEQAAPSTPALLPGPTATSTASTTADSEAAATAAQTPTPVVPATPAADSAATDTPGTSPIDSVPSGDSAPTP